MTGQCLHFALLSIVFFWSIAQVELAFNFTTCPSPDELQTDFVKANFSLEKFAGTYYELAMHDYTQKPACPKPDCVRSQKRVQYDTRQVNDTFTLKCLGGQYEESLIFNFTDRPGVFRGFWEHLPELTIPDTVVDITLDSTGGYERVLEFQCVEFLGRVRFVGINWYSRIQVVDDAYLQSFLQMARDRGLGVYMDEGEKVFMPNQRNCTYKQR